MTSDEIGRPRLANAATTAAGLLMGYDWKVWFWGDSVGLEGLLDAGAMLGTREYEAFVYGLVCAWRARRLPRRRWDYTAPGVALLRVYQSTGDRRLLEAAVEHAEYLAGFRKAENGAYIRYEDAKFNLPPNVSNAQASSAADLNVTAGGPCAFVDNMHFDGPFFCKLYEVTQCTRYKELAIANIVPSIDVLFDHQRHLFSHFWSEERHSSNGVFWGRGQGWALLGMIGVLESLSSSDSSFQMLLGVLRKHCTALAETQDQSGHWHTVIDDAGSYLESSVAAFVIDGFSRAIRHGWLPDTYVPMVDRAMRALLASVAADGKLSGVSYETYPSFEREHYRKMPRDAMVPWGQGPLLTAISSYQALRERRSAA